MQPEKGHFPHSLRALTLRTKERRSLALDDAPDFSGAHRARFTVSSIHPRFNLKPARVAIGVAEVF
jgi:hypothetical protein